MIPNHSLSNPTLEATYIPPDGPPYDPLISMQLGGIGLSDTSEGLEYQYWTLQATGFPFPSNMYLSAPNTPSTLLFSTPFITSCSLCFDQNMKPAVGYMANGVSAFWWYDATIPGYTTLTLDPSVTSVQVTFDDKRSQQVGAGRGDMILTYTAHNNLYYRQERDRFTIEYLLQLNVSVPNPQVIKVGMNEDWRLQWYISGSLYS